MDSSHSAQNSVPVHDHCVQKIHPGSLKSFGYGWGVKPCYSGFYSRKIALTNPSLSPKIYVKEGISFPGL